MSFQEGHCCISQMGFPQIETVDWPSWDLAGLGKFKLTAGLFAWSIKRLLLEEGMGAG